MKSSALFPKGDIFKHLVLLDLLSKRCSVLYIETLRFIRFFIHNLLYVVWLGLGKDLDLD